MADNKEEKTETEEERIWREQHERFEKILRKHLGLD